MEDYVRITNKPEVIYLKSPTFVRQVSLKPDLLLTTLYNVSQLRKFHTSYGQRLDDSIVVHRLH